MSDSFNLWDLSPLQKKELLAKFHSLSSAKRPAKKDNFMEISEGKDIEFESYAKEFEKDIEVIDWSKITISETEGK